MADVRSQVPETTWRVFFATFFVFALILSSACIHKKRGHVTPFERAVTYNTALAQLNNSVAQGVIDAAKANMMPVPTANELLSYQKLVADDHAKLTKILGAGQDGATGQGEQIKGIILEMSTQAKALIANGGLGVKNPRTQQTFLQDIDSMLNLMNTMVSTLQSAGVLK